MWNLLIKKLYVKHFYRNIQKKLYEWMIIIIIIKITNHESKSVRMYFERGHLIRLRVTLLFGKLLIDYNRYGILWQKHMSSYCGYNFHIDHQGNSFVTFAIFFFYLLLSFLFYSFLVLILLSFLVLRPRSQK